MSLLFTENNPERCDNCQMDRFIIHSIAQITKDKKEQHISGYAIECIDCAHRKYVDKNYFHFELSRR